METSNFSGSPQDPRAMTTSTKPAGWRLVNFAQPTINSHPNPHHLETHEEPTASRSAVRHEFEQRLTRFGIKLSEAKSDPASSNSDEPTRSTHERTCAVTNNYTRGTLQQSHLANNVNDEDFPTLEPPTIATFTSSKRESKLEIVQKQLQEAQKEAQIWKERFEAQERELRMAYGETMKWRMEYEDLYSTIIRDQPLQSRGVQVKRHGTKSLG